MTKFCKTRVSDALRNKMEQLKEDPAAVKQFGIDFGTQMCRELLADPQVKVLHFYTLNLERVVYGVLDNLGISKNALATVDEHDAESMVAKGSAWARVGDKVKTLYGQGTVQDLDQATGKAKIEIETWLMAGGQKPTAYLAKGHYQKI